MKLLLDQNLSFKLVSAFADVFPSSSHVRLLGLDRADDRTIWSRAAQDGFVLVTLDGDFAELSMLHGAPPKVVWLRCGNQPTAQVEALLRANASKVLLLETDPSVDCLEIG